jgi:hypothetical protein
MIADPKALEDLRASWNGVRLLRSKIQRALLGSFAMGSPFVFHIADHAHNLPFLKACAVLNDVLKQLAKERRFPSQGKLLGGLIRASVQVSPPVSWLNLPLKKALKDREALAHRAAIIPRADCWTYIAAIEAELVAWGIVLPVEDEAP